jgi:hypothetical protein
VGGVGLRCAPSAARGVLQAQHGRDHQHLGQRALVDAAQDHPAQPRIDRQPAELVADRGEVAALVEGAQLLEHAVALVDRALAGRIEEREASTAPRPSDFIRRMTPARPTRLISGSV